MAPASPSGGRVALALLCALAAAGGWTALFWWHLIGRGEPLKLGPLLKIFRR